MQNDNDSRAAPDDQRKVLINGRKYFKVTTKHCPVCTSTERFLYLKLRLGDTAILECSYCDTTVPYKKELVPEAADYPVKSGD